MANLTAEQKELSDSMSRRESLRFLHAQLDALEARIKEWSTYTAEAYPAGRIPPGETDVMEVYEEEKALVQELIRDCQVKLLPEAVHERLDEARRTVSSLIAKERRDAAEARNLRKAQRDAAILAEILERWSSWLKAERSPGA